MDDGKVALHALMTRLLDFGARNALVNFRGAKSSAAEVVAPDAAALFEAIDASDGAIRFEAATGDACGRWWSRWAGRWRPPASSASSPS